MGSHLLFCSSQALNPANENIHLLLRQGHLWHERLIVAGVFRKGVDDGFMEVVFVDRDLLAAAISSNDRLLLAEKSGHGWADRVLVNFMAVGAIVLKGSESKGLPVCFLKLLVFFFKLLVLLS